MRISDWSSDVCSSDLLVLPEDPAHVHRPVAPGDHAGLLRLRAWHGAISLRRQRAERLRVFGIQDWVPACGDVRVPYHPELRASFGCPTPGTALLVVLGISYRSHDVLRGSRQLRRGLPLGVCWFLDAVVRSCA